MGRNLEVDELWVSRITKSLAGMEYGTVQIVVHDGRIVQIERTEKNRFDVEGHARYPSAETGAKRKK